MDFLIWHLLRESARRWPEKEALIHGEERLSYSQVADRVNGLAANIHVLVGALCLQLRHIPGHDNLFGDGAYLQNHIDADSLDLESNAIANRIAAPSTGAAGPVPKRVTSR